MPDSVANFQTVDAQGNVGADFAGHLSASAIDLDLPLNGAVVQDQNRIQWKRVTDGVARGGLYATQLYGDDDSMMDLYMQSPDGTHRTEFVGHPADSGGMNSRAEVSADGWLAMLIDAAGGSDYLRGSGLQVLNHTSGAGGWTTAVPTPGGGAGFVAKSYKALIINWATAYTVSGGTPIIQVYFSSTYKGDMQLPAASPVNVRVILTPLAFVADTAPGVTYYVWFRLVAGNSGNDLGGTIIIQ